jgi:hypothetical protein
MKIRAAALSLGIVVLMLSCTGCAAVKDYAGDRAVDFVDIFIAEFNTGNGLEFHAQLTGYIGTSLGGANTRSIYMHGRDHGLGRRNARGLLVFGQTSFDYSDAKSMRGLPKRYGRHRRAWVAFLPAGLFGGGRKSAPVWPDNLNVEVGFNFLVAGGGVGVNPIELVDFVLGIFTIDLVGDDELGEEPGRRDRPVTKREQEIFLPEE